MKGLVHLCNPAASSAAVEELVVFEVGKVFDLHYLEILIFMLYITLQNLSLNNGNEYFSQIY